MILWKKFSDYIRLNDRLWKIFSEYIRLRDADANGYCRCITSGRIVHWKECDAGHFISRRHLSTKFDEQNVNAQSRHDKRFAAWKKYEHGLAIDRKYGQGTAEKLLIKSKQLCKISSFDIKVMENYYKEKVKELKKLKGL